MKELKDKSILCIDGAGLFCSFAIKLSDYFGKVFYYNNPNDIHPSFVKAAVGTGFDEITKIEDIFQSDGDYDFDSIDLFVILDNGYGWLSEHLKNIGKRVFSVMQSEEIELNREYSIKLMKEVGLPVPETQFITGLDKLREYLKKNDNKIIKISKYRYVS